MGDESWAKLARNSREALRLLGYDVEPVCLPGEADPCGGSFAQHAMANLGALKAVADHHLWHLGGLGQAHGEIYWNIRRDLEEKDAAKLRDQYGVAPGDEITYRSVHAGEHPHRARVERVKEDGVVVVDTAGMPLPHLVTWDRVIGKEGPHGD